MAQHYGPADLEEAQAYLADPVVRQRYEVVVAVIFEQLRNPQKRLALLMGTGPRQPRCRQDDQPPDVV